MENFAHIRLEFEKLVSIFSLYELFFPSCFKITVIKSCTVKEERYTKVNNLTIAEKS